MFWISALFMVEDILDISQKPRHPLILIHSARFQFPTIRMHLSELVRIYLCSSLKNCSISALQLLHCQLNWIYVVLFQNFHYGHVHWMAGLEVWDGNAYSASESRCFSKNYYQLLSDYYQLSGEVARLCSKNLVVIFPELSTYNSGGGWLQ